MAHNGTGKQVGVTLIKKKVGGTCDHRSAVKSAVYEKKQYRPSAVCRKSSLKLKKKSVKEFNKKSISETLAA